MHLKNYQMAQLIRFHMPKLFNHLRQIQMTTDYFTSKWIMTIFSCFLPFEMLPTIFDMFLQDGWKSVFKVGIALLRGVESKLLTMEMATMCNYFRDNVRKEIVVELCSLLLEAKRVRVN